MAARGSYVLLIRVPKKQNIGVGSLGITCFQRGYYAYIGSALGGFKSRLNRHLKRDKIPKWHIDYLMERASLRRIIVCESDERLECAIADSLDCDFEAVPRFGSSDCRCRSHLYFSPRYRLLKDAIMAAAKSTGAKVRSLDAETYRDVETQGICGRGRQAGKRSHNEG